MIRWLPICLTVMVTHASVINVALDSDKYQDVMAIQSQNLGAFHQTRRQLGLSAQAFLDHFLSTFRFKF